MEDLTGSFAISRNPDTLQFHVNLEEVHAAPTATKRGFGDLVLDDLLALDVDVGTAPNDALIQALRHAIAARDAYATWRLWAKIEDYRSRSPPSLGMQHMPITVDLLRFLVCQVREPTLVLALAEQVWAETANVLASKLPTDRAASRDRQNLVALVAAVFVGITRVRIDDADQERCEPTDLWDWDDLLARLMQALPTWPMPLWRYDTPLGTSSDPKSLSLLELAVACSADSTKAVCTVLRQCRFSYTAYMHALESTLRPGVLRSHTVLPVFRELYQRLLVPPRPAYEDQAKTALDRAWGLVVADAPALEPAVVCIGTEPEIVYGPRSGGRSAANAPAHPDVHLALLDVMVAVHDELDENEDTRLCALACCALTRCSECYGPRPHIVGKLVQLVLKRGKSEMFLWAPRLVSRLYQEYPDVADTLQPYWRLPAHAGILKGALGDCMGAGKRHSVHSILGVLKAVPEPKGDYLERYIEKLVPGEHVCAMHMFQSMAPASWSRYCMEIKDQLVALLELGAPWTDADLTDALRVASEVRSGIAVGVLVSPPYEVPLPDGDAFVEVILQQVLAPGAPAVHEAHARFNEAAL